MIFQNKNIHTLALKIDNIDIEKITDFNFLGLIIDKNINWKKHTEINMRILEQLVFLIN